MVMTTDSEQDKKREIANKIAKKREEGKSDEQIGIEMTDDFLAELGILRDRGDPLLSPILLSQPGCHPARPPSRSP